MGNWNINISYRGWGDKEWVKQLTLRHTWLMLTRQEQHMLIVEQHMLTFASCLITSIIVIFILRIVGIRHIISRCQYLLSLLFSLSLVFSGSGHGQALEIFHFNMHRLILIGLLVKGGHYQILFLSGSPTATVLPKLLIFYLHQHLVYGLYNKFHWTTEKKNCATI